MRAAGMMQRMSLCMHGLRFGPSSTSYGVVSYPVVGCLVATQTSGEAMVWAQVITVIACSIEHLLQPSAQLWHFGALL
jgi:hypothetical protein